jgi:hypothetical protein
VTAGPFCANTGSSAPTATEIRRPLPTAAVVAAKDEQAAQTPAERADQLARWRRTYKATNRLEPFRPLPALRLTKRATVPAPVGGPQVAGRAR